MTTNRPQNGTTGEGGDGAVLTIAFPAGERDGPPPDGRGEGARAPGAIGPRDLIEASVVSHGGRMAGTDRGGRLRAVLPGAVPAVRCALAIQRALAQDAPEAGVRIGVDVAADAPSPEGAGAIEDLAHPGGISVSAPIFARVRTRFDVVYEELGPRRLAGHEGTVPVYRVLFDTRSRASRREIGINPDRAKLFKWVGAAGFLILMVMALRPLVLDRLSPGAERGGEAQGVVVVPFAGAGRTADAIDPARLRAAVIAALAARPAPKTLSERGYRLEGEIRGEGANARLFVRLVAAASGETLWSADYAAAGADAEALAAEIAARVAAALEAGGGG